MVGFDSNLKVLGIIILHQTETPGLGTRVLEVADDTTIIDLITGRGRKSETPQRPWFKEQFVGLSMSEPVKIEFKGDWTPQMRNDLLRRNAITSITGATITVRAILNSIENKASVLKKILAEKNKEVLDENNDELLSETNYGENE
jgi:Na+-translocating ferredoxin:NAD+ oxidoreductase RnfG subunit